MHYSFYYKYIFIINDKYNDKQKNKKKTLIFYPNASKVHLHTIMRVQKMKIALNPITLYICVYSFLHGKTRSWRTMKS